MKHLTSTRSARTRIALGIVIIALASAIAMLAHPVIGNTAAILTLVIGVMTVGASQGLSAALLAATIAFFFFNFFMAEPVLSLNISNGEDVAPLIAFNLAAAIAGILSGKLKDRAAAAELATAWTSLLVEVGNELQGAISRRDITEKLNRKAAESLGSNIEIIFMDEEGYLPPSSPPIAFEALSSQGPKVDGGMVAMPLSGMDGSLGVLVAHRSTVQQHEFLHALANLTAIALERVAMLDRIGEVRTLERSEQLKSALLSSVSHDFRTPLATISASASSLVEYGERLTNDQKSLFLSTILQECGRLNHFTSNLLELSRLESGAQIPSEVIAIEDIVSGALNNPVVKNSERTVLFFGQPGLFIRVNPAIFELTLTNILSNAIKFSGDPAPIKLEAAKMGSSVIIRVSDAGVGIPPGELTRIFEKFYRVETTQGVPQGSGLGLAIARGFVAASGGTIRAEVPGLDGKGASIVMEFPAVQTETLSVGA